MKSHAKPSQVASVEDLRRTVRAFMEEPKLWRSAVARNGQYFVHVRKNDKHLFGLSKFCNVKDISLRRYIRGMRHKVGSGGPAQIHIEKIVGRKWTPLTLVSPDVQNAFARWWENIFPEGRGTERIRILSLDDLPSSETDQVFDDVAEVQSRGDITETVRKRLTDARKGQGRFRREVVRICQNRCIVTQCRALTLLQASHIKPWRKSNDAERLDPYNGLLLSPNLDKAFDRGLITFGKDGRIQISRKFDEHDARRLGVDGTIKASLVEKQKLYLKFHEENCFQG